jgi:hypothetical protein
LRKEKLPEEKSNKNNYPEIDQDFNELKKHSTLLSKNVPMINISKKAF